MIGTHFFFLIKSLNNGFFSGKKTSLLVVYAKIMIFFPEDEQLKKGNYLHCFGKKHFQNLKIRIFLMFPCLHEG